MVGILSLAGLFLALLPDLGFLLWLSVILAAGGLFLGLSSIAQRRNRVVATIGTIMCGLTAVAGAVTMGIGNGVI